MINKEIEKTKAIKVKAFYEADVQALAQVYDEQAEILVDSGQTVKGIQEISAQTQQFMDLIGAMAVELKTIDIWPRQDVIYEKGVFTYHYRKDGRVFNRGYYLYIWKIQEDQSVKVYREIEMDEVKWDDEI